ncbi:MAG: HD domain-containing protein [Mycoplasma sp.]
MLVKKNIYKFIKDPVYGEIEISESDIFIYELLETREFKRLRNIYQLGECHNVFFGATHSRYSHSLGVYFNAKRFLMGIDHQIPKKDEQAILTAALLHDLGHGPRSHCFEYYTNVNHEDFTIAIIENNKTEVNQVLNKYGISIKDVINILTKKHEVKFYWQIISSQIDADRLDYLMRDSLFVGANYGNIDAGIILKWASLSDNELVFNIKAIGAIEDVLFSRWQMFKQIYCNKKVMCYEFLMRKIFARFKELSKSGFQFKNKYNLYTLLSAFVNDTKWNLEDFLQLDETTLRLILLSWNDEEDSILKDLTNSYLYKNLYQCSDISYIEANPGISSEEVKYDVLLYKGSEPIYIIDDNNQVNEISNYSFSFLSYNKDNKWTNRYFFHLK